MKNIKLIYIIALLILIPVTQAENYANYQSAKIDLKLGSEIDIIANGDNPRLIEATATLNLIPLKTDTQNILEQTIYTEPEAEVTKHKDKITFFWEDITADKISYQIETELEIKNKPLKIKDKVRYPISSSKYNKFTEEETFININSEIEKLADELFEKETDLFHAVYKTAKWIEENIEYKRTPDTENNVKKSSWVLQNKHGVCDELTNLFMSILRAKNIPAKFISGMVYSTKNKDFENHGWAEVYFPDHGWLPFDLTYLQFGWVDPTHIKLAESIDSNLASIDYHWRSSGVEIDVNKLDINAEIKQTGDQIIPLLTSSVEPVKTKVGFGSYVPVKVTVENPTDFYMTPTIHLTKAPPVINKNKKTIFIKPNQIKNTYFLVKVPTELNENYIFKSTIEAFTSFGQTSSSMIEFSSDFEKITKEQAESIIEKLTQKETKSELKGMSLTCTTKSTEYYEDENIEVICILENKQDTKQFDLCLLNDCKDITLKELEERIIIFKTKATNKLVITAENEQGIKYSTIDLNIIKVPNIIIKDIRPLIIDYYEEVDLIIEVEATIPAHNAIIYLREQEILNMPLLQGKKKITLKIKGKDLINDIKLKTVYQDKLGKDYSKTEKYLVTVKNKPWYIYLFGWLL